MGRHVGVCAAGKVPGVLVGSCFGVQLGSAVSTVVSSVGWSWPEGVTRVSVVARFTSELVQAAADLVQITDIRLVIA